MLDTNNRSQILLEYNHTFQCSNYTILAFATIHTIVLVKVIGIAKDIVHNTLNINALASDTRMLTMIITHMLNILSY